MDLALSYALLAFAGAVAAAINVVAGGGSFLTLPVLIWMGLPPTVANATNRVGILAQSLWVARAFDRRGVLERRWVGATAPPAVVGAVLGTGLALLVDDADFRRLLATLMVVLTLLSLFIPRQPRDTQVAPTSPLVSGGFFLVGVYGGFMQAGVGFPDSLHHDSGGPRPGPVATLSRSPVRCSSLRCLWRFLRGRGWSNGVPDSPSRRVACSEASSASG